MPYESIGIWPTWFFLTLSFYRLVRLITTDDITQPIRSPLTSIPFLGDLITCPWCVSIWIVIPLYYLAAQLISLPLPVLQAGATLTVIGLIGNHDD